MITKTNYPSAVLWTTNPRLQICAALVSLCLIIVYSVSVCIYRPYDNIGWSSMVGGQVAIVGEYGAQEAGFQADDLVLAIDDVLVDRWMQRPLYRPFLRTGDQVLYKVQRAEKILIIAATMGSYAEEPAFLAALIGTSLLSLCFWATGCSLCLFAHPTDIRARLIGASWLLASVATVAGNVGSESQFWGYGTVMKVCLGLLVFVNLAQHLYFPAPVFTSRYRRWLLRLSAAVSLALVFLTLIDDVIAKPRLNILSGLHWVVYACFLFSILMSVGLLIYSRFLADDPDVRRQTGIVMFGTALGFAPFFILNLLPSLLFGPDKPFLGSGIYSIFFMLLIPLSYAYVIYQRKLLKVDWVINRLVVLFVMILLVLLLSVTILGSLASWLNLSPELPILGGLFAAIAVSSATGIQKRAQIGVDHLLYGTHYDHALITSSLSSQLARALDRQTLTHLLTECFPQQMGIRRGALLLLKDDRLNAQTSAGEFSVAVDDILCATLLNGDVPTRAQNLWGLVPEAIQVTWSFFEWGEVFVPIVFKDSLHGILILGERVANDLYSERDLHIITAVADQAALACANIQLVEQLRGLTRELVRIDEEHRRELSRDLHDTVLQNIYFIKQKVHNPELGRYLNDIIASLRRTIKIQRTSMLDQGIALALKDLVDDMQEVIGLDGAYIDWQSNVDKALRVHDDLATNMYRITQEALSNAIKHAHAEKITVSLEQKQDKLTLRIKDDGIGMVVNNHSGGQHYGLVGMYERSLMVDAKLEISSALREGTTITMETTI